MTTLNGYLRRVQKDKKLNAIRNKIRGSTDYNDVNEFAVRSGEILNEELSRSAADDFPDLAESYYQLVTDGAVTVQQNMNNAYKIGLEAKRAGIDMADISRMIDAVQNGDTEALINFGQRLVDQTAKKNADLYASVGLEPIIIREAESVGSVTRKKTVISKKGKAYNYMVTYQVPCKWCASLAGRYKYSDVKSGDDVFRRHKGCRCSVTFVDGSNAQDVWSKTEWHYGDAESQAQAIRLKEQQKELEERVKEEERKKRAAAVEVLINKYHYSAKNASIFYNMHKDEIAEFGIDYLMRS